MRPLLRSAMVLLLTAAAALPAQAQYGKDQQKALKGLQKVLVVFAEPTHKVEAALLSQMQDAISLELRKAGLRMAKDSADVDLTRDGFLNISLFIVTGIPDVENVRMDVEQLVVPARTQEPLQLVTWFYEDRAAGGWRTNAQPLLIKAANRFLSDWLTANGR